MTSPIKVQVSVKVPVQEAWSFWTDPLHIIKWNAASDDWHTTFAENDLRKGGSFSSRMEAKDGSVGFDFEGTYTQVLARSKIVYTMGDRRKVTVTFLEDKISTTIIEEFDPESTNSHEKQKIGWQSILNNFKRYVEKKGKSEILIFSAKISAPVGAVYEKMLGEKSYRDWTKAFNADSHYEGTWTKGSLIRFIGVDHKGDRGGLISRIRENMPQKFVSIEHLGLIHGQDEIMSGPEVEEWAGVLENYRFIPDKDKNTLLEVAMDSNEQFKSYFSETWPKAMEKLKKLCE